jgi:hypothetical protein
MSYRELLEMNFSLFKEKMEEARKISVKNFGRKILFYAPGFAHYKTRFYSSKLEVFPTISVTGSYCALKCKHCGGTVLNTMFSAPNPVELFKLCKDLKEKGAVGCLISGGCLPSGSVPLGNFAETIKRIKRELKLTVFVHTGIIDEETALQLKEAEVDAALIDVIGCEETLREIYHLDAGIDKIEGSLKALWKARIPLVPHVLVGLHYGKLKGEVQALKIISKYPPNALVVIAFMPIRGTQMEGVEPPSPEEIAKILTIARLMFRETPVLLGCMRPKGRHRALTDVLAVKSGVNAIAFPVEKAVEFAKNLGYETIFSPYCCSKIFLDIKREGFSITYRGLCSKT